MKEIRCFTVLSLCTAFMWACGDDTGGNVDVSSDSGSADLITDTSDVDSTNSSGDWDAPAESGSWQIVHNYRGRVQGSNLGENDLWLIDSNGTQKSKLTDLAGLENVGTCVDSGKECNPSPEVNQVTGCEEEEECRALSCNYGCFISDDLKWLAIADGPPSAQGFDFRIGQFKSNMEFKLIKNLILADKIDFQFVGDRLYYSEIAECVGASCQYLVSYIDLSTLVTEELFTFPPGSDLEGSTFKGHFKASPNGERLILLNTTIRSVAVHMYKFGVGLIKLDFICKFGTEDNCEGTGSEYNDQDPVALSHDSRWAVFFTFSDRWQRARVYDLDNPGVITLAVLASVPSGSYISKACEFGVLEDWQWPRVIGDPKFTPDGSEIIFLTENDCPAPNGTHPKKSLRNIMRIKLDTLVSGKTIEESDVFSITENPMGDIKDNVFVSGYGVSPDGATVVFTGSPSFDQSGEPLKDSSSRHRNDREVYRVRLDGTNRIQMTNDPSWEAQSPHVVPVSP
jgi:hypothetical protein